MSLDFSGQNLQGRSFKGQVLIGTDFSYADIRGADFTSANLIGANFSNAKAGLQISWKLFLILASFVLSGLSGFCLSVVLRYVTWSTTLVDPVIMTLVWIGSGTVSITAVLVLALVVTLAKQLAGNKAGIGAVAIGICAVMVAGAKATVAFSAIATAFTLVLLGNYIAWRTLSGDEKCAWIHKLAVIFATMGGTSFRATDLTDANFASATLKSTDFRNANLTRTCWYKAKMLDFARPGKTYLQNAQVRQLLVTGRGQDKNFDREILRGINLQAANLTDASFIGADLSEANLQEANLSRAKLVQTQLAGTNFTGANLTGAYIEDWGITSDTKFDGVRCEYVYMRVPTKENPDPLRKPDNNKEVFADGEFGDFIQPIFDTLELYHNQGVDPRAIAISFKQLTDNNPNAELEIVAMEKRGQDKLLLRAKTSTFADQPQLSAEYFETYNQIKKLSEEDLKVILTEKNIQIRRLENMIMTALERPSFYTEGGNITIGNINQTGGTFHTGDIDVIKNIDNVGDITGNIENFQPVATIESNDDFIDALEIQIIRGSGMLVGEQSELILEVTNACNQTMEHLEIEIIQDSAEYQVNSENQVSLKILNAGESREVSFYLQMNFAKQIAVNYKVNGKLRKPPLYINAVQDNPYLYGSPVEGEKAFFGRQRELEQIIQAVTKPTKQDILIVGERRTGKTSLLNQLQKRLEIPLIPVYVVLNTSEEPTAESILKLIIQETLHNLVQRNVLRENNIEEYFFNNIDFIKQYKQIILAAKVNISNLKIVLLLDEADYLLKVKQKQLNTIDERIQNILRAALQSNEIGTDLRAVVAATTDLSTYISQHSSPFYNHFRFVPLKPLSVKETEDLIVKPASMLGYSYPDSAIEKIIKLSGGQPYYAQAICYEAFENALQAQRNYISDEDVYIAEQKIVEDFFDGFLSGFWNRCNEVEMNFLRNLAKTNITNNISKIKIKRLLDWQIIIEDVNGNYSLSSELIKQWVIMASCK
ncbi:hypothetical protein WA1_50570 [Scytonema hofmannii PCC 7110]|uniref:AAA+ ATPase domain-containing protein n=1 Tax=Scytonema hofmannii PCC 7110 TaxID=128403 RepID=A0A139WQF4_9CYAN|nr:pentapeptide repeat-containing protein [Scytonema hofmannii]KYC34663.1 hypothetical protein WA1_50570 [Scytonema hofmannii PCC 7110]